MRFFTYFFLVCGKRLIFAISFLEVGILRYFQMIPRTPSEHLMHVQYTSLIQGFDGSVLSILVIVKNIQHY